MGYHTWFYKSKAKNTEIDKAESWLKAEYDATFRDELNISLETAQRILFNKDQNIQEDDLPTDVNEEKLNELMNKFHEDFVKISMDEKHDNDAEPHDVFRLWIHYDGTLDSFEETVKFINTFEKHINFHISKEICMTRLEAFFLKYKDGYIDFG